MGHSLKLMPHWWHTQGKD